MSARLRRAFWRLGVLLFLGIGTGCTPSAPVTPAPAVARPAPAVYPEWTSFTNTGRIWRAYTLRDGVAHNDIKYLTVMPGDSLVFHGGGLSRYRPQP